MSMFCYQCQETLKNYGCTQNGVCGKKNTVSNLQDLLIYNLKGLSQLVVNSRKFGIDIEQRDIDESIIEGLFATITNVNFDENYFIKKISKILEIKKGLLSRTLDALKENDKERFKSNLTNEALWYTHNQAEYHTKALDVRITNEQNEDLRSLKELLTYGIKGISAYLYHANMAGFYDKALNNFIMEGLSATTDKSLSLDDLFNLVLKCGEHGVKVMALLDKANTTRYGNPEPTKVNIGVRKNPAILVSGHDLVDLEELLKQTENSGVDIYTHGEMLPANYYPQLKKYKHLAGNYGSAWWNQKEEFEKFNGPVLFTTNCLMPPKESYKDRVYTTGPVGFPGVKHIDEVKGRPKDFGAIIEHAKKCKPPEEIEKGEIIGGFAHEAVLGAADKIIENIKAGKIKKFVVMAGCDGAQKSREYYTDFAKELPNDAIILTAGCAKYRYNKLNLGEIDGIPRVLDAGQCNDSYSLAVVALKLAEVLGVGVNDLPIVYNIAWYEQKAVIVLLALLYLGVKKIHLGPTLPAFISPNVAKILIDKFEIGTITDVKTDIGKMIQP